MRTRIGAVTVAIAIIASISAACGGGSGPTIGLATATTGPASATVANTGLPTGGAARSVAPEATPQHVTSPQGTDALLLVTPFDSYPLDIVEAFGSIWVAHHHLDEVTRYDPDTLDVLAHVATGPGPGWFAVTPDALWVTNQNGTGWTRIDAMDNSAREIGGPAPCGIPALATDGKTLWLNSCDEGQHIGLDSETEEQTNSVPAAGLGDPVVVGDDILASSDEGLFRLDADRERFVPIDGPGGFALGFDGETFWLKGDQEVMRVDPDTGEVVATVEVAGAGKVSFNGERAWIVARNDVKAVDLSSSTIVQTVTLGLVPTSVFAADDAVFVTDSFAGQVWRFVPAP